MSRTKPPVRTSCWAGDVEDVANILRNGKGEHSHIEYGAPTFQYYTDKLHNRPHPQELEPQAPTLDALEDQ